MTIFGSAVGRRRTSLSILSVLVAGSLATPAAAQDATPIQTRALSPVYVHSITGAETRGQLLRLGPASLTLLDEGATREIPFADVTRIEARGDSVKNGAIIGAAVLAGWCAIICPQGLDGYSSQFGYILVVNTLLGAAIGAGIDGMHVGRTTIYQTAETTAGRRRTGMRATFSKRFRF